MPDLKGSKPFNGEINGGEPPPRSTKKPDLSEVEFALRANSVNKKTVRFFCSATPSPRGSAPKTPLLPRTRLSPCGIFLLVITAAAFCAGNLRQELALSLLGAVLLSVWAYCLILGLAAALIHRREALAIQIHLNPRSIAVGDAVEISFPEGRFRSPGILRMPGVFRVSGILGIPDILRIPGILIRCCLRLETRDGRRVEHTFDPVHPAGPAGSHRDSAAGLSGKTGKRNSLVFPLRGAYYSGGDELAIFDAFGIFNFSWPLPQEEEVRVLVSPRPATEALILQPRTGGQDHRGGSHYRRTDDLIDHRPYIPGDDPRRINWKLYSHGPANSLFVREGEPEPPPHSQFLILADTEADPALYSPQAAREGVDLLCAQLLAIALDLSGRGMDLLTGYTGGALRGGDAAELGEALAWPAALPLSGKAAGSPGRGGPGDPEKHRANAPGPLPELPAAERGTCILALPRTTIGGGAAGSSALDRFLSRPVTQAARENPPCDIIFIYPDSSLREAAEDCARVYGVRRGVRSFAMAVRPGGTGKGTP